MTAPRKLDVKKLLDSMAEQGSITTKQLTYKCGGRMVRLRFSPDVRRAHAALGFFRYSTLFADRGPEILPFLTREVEVVVKAVRQMSARFTADECRVVLSNSWPCETNFDRIFQAVNERVQYPLPKPDLPGIERRTSSAQGQTKKDGSHSHDRHRYTPPAPE